jgi:hypothetical protein
MAQNKVKSNKAKPHEIKEGGIKSNQINPMG